jgi:VWFA-related protein
MAALGALAIVAPSARPASDYQTPEYGTSTAIVALDLIVRNKAGRPVRDLGPDEIKVLEDGTPVEIQSFRYVSATNAGAGPDGTPPPTAQPGRTDATTLPRLTALVFDSLDPEGARLARRTALDLLERGPSAGSLIAVFKIGDGLRLVQPFTADPEALRKAVEAASAWSRTKAPSTRDALRAATEARRVADPDGPSGFVQGTETASDATIALAPNARADPLAPVLTKLLEVTANALRLADAGHAAQGIP